MDAGGSQEPAPSTKGRIRGSKKQEEEKQERKERKNEAKSRPVEWPLAATTRCCQSGKNSKKCQSAKEPLACLAPTRNGRRVFLAFSSPFSFFPLLASSSLLCLSRLSRMYPVDVGVNGRICAGRSAERKRHQSQSSLLTKNPGLIGWCV